MTITVSNRHLPVMLSEVLEWLAPKAGGCYLDGTIGLGGHSAAILEHVERAGGKAKLVGLDRDITALTLAWQRLASSGHDVYIKHALFSKFPDVLKAIGWNGLDGALLDLGISSLQLDSPERGFSFQADGPLDMRMDVSNANDKPVAQLVNKASVDELKTIILELGDEPMASRIAKAIAKARIKAPIETTKQLVAVVTAAYPTRWRFTARRHPATRTFQALRIAVNRELEELQTFLEIIPAWLKPGSRIVVLSFHSLEDRLVKRAFKAEAKGCICLRQQPRCICSRMPRLHILTKGPIRPTDTEVTANPRARSARLRAAERLPDFNLYNPNSSVSTKAQERIAA